MGQQVPLATNVIFYPVHVSIRQIKVVVMMPRSFTGTEVSEEHAASTYRVKRF